MPRFFMVLGLAVIAVLMTVNPLGACGDRLLVLGHGVRFQIDTADYPASILLFMNPHAPGAAALGDVQLQSIMRQAGHRLHSARSKEDVAAALKNGRYDIVLTDVGDAPALQEIIDGAPSQPVLLPWVYQNEKPTAADKDRYQASLKSAKAKYRFALRAPASVGSFLSTIDRVMETRPKEARLKSSGTGKISLLQ
jgi:hypothetical protein